jgi:quercetin dioxygenase-like cupin family protein
MKNSYLKIILFSSAFMLLFSSCKNEKQNKSTESVNKQEVAEKEGERNIIFENDNAMVVKIRLAPGEFISPPDGEGKTRLIYSLSDYTLNWDKGDSKMEKKSWKQNDVHFHEAGKHYVKNIGSTTAEWLVFVKKSNNLPECGENTVENDVTSVTPEFAQTLFDNHEFKMAVVSLPEGGSIPKHSGINRIIYALSDYQILYESNKEEQTEKTFITGDIHWHEACQHGLENIGDDEAKYLVVSYKR